MTILQVCLYIPSIPQASIALTSILVSLNGTFSGNLSLFIATSNKFKLRFTETVSEINVHNFPSKPLQHNITWMPIT